MCLSPQIYIPKSIFLILLLAKPLNSMQQSNSTVKYTLWGLPFTAIPTSQSCYKSDVAEKAHVKGLSEPLQASLGPLEELFTCWLLSSLCLRSWIWLAHSSSHTWAHNLLCLKLPRYHKAEGKLPKVIVSTCLLGSFALYQQCEQWLPSWSTVVGGWALRQTHLHIACDI